MYNDINEKFLKEYNYVYSLYITSTWIYSLCQEDIFFSSKM